MKNAIKIIVTALMMLAMTAVLASCAGKTNIIAQPVPDSGAQIYEITGSCTVERIDEKNVKVHCSANIMDGAVVAVCLDTYSGENIAKKVYTKESENFYAEFTINSNTKGPIYASLVCMPSTHGKQPTEIKNAYGAQFQNITGDCIVWNTEGNCVVIMSDAFEM